MGNCCGSQNTSQQAQLNKVTYHADKRLSNWKATGAIGLRDANLKVDPKLEPYWRALTLAWHPSAGLC